MLLFVATGGKADNENIRKLRADAEQGDASAQDELGLRYELGEGVRRDYVEAVKWYYSSAKNGNSNALLNLSSVIENYQIKSTIPIDLLQSINVLLAEKEQEKIYKVYEQAKAEEKAAQAQARAEAKALARERAKDIAIRASLKIGDEYKEGRVFLIWQQGQNGYVKGEVHGLIAKKEDELGSRSWWLFNTSAPSYNDWYMPRIGELSQLYKNRKIIGGFAEGDYWSSSEESKNTSWYYNFDFGFIGSTDKIYSKYVRLIRSF